MKFVSRLAVAIAAVLGFVTPALAATTTATVAAPVTQSTPGQGLQLQPPLITSQADPGQTTTINITIRNISSGTLAITAVANDFGAKGEDGQPQIFLNNDSESRFSLRQWISPIAPFRLNSLQTATIPVKVAIPANAEPGGHYAVIRFSGASPDVSGSGDNSSSSGNLGLDASIGALVLFTVNGDIQHNLSPIDIAAENKDGQRHKLFEQGPITLIERLKNTGSVHELPTGNVTVKNLFGKTVATLPFNDKKGNILPDAIRKFSQTIDKKGLFGRYSIESNITYNNGQKLTFPKSSFWVIPWKLLLIVLVVLIAIFFLLRFALKRYNEHIIAQARSRR